MSTHHSSTITMDKIWCEKSNFQRDNLAQPELLVTHYVFRDLIRQLDEKYAGKAPVRRYELDCYSENLWNEMVRGVAKTPTLVFGMHVRPWRYHFTHDEQYSWKIQAAGSTDPYYYQWKSKQVGEAVDKDLVQVIYKVLSMEEQELLLLDDGSLNTWFMTPYCPRYTYRARNLDLTVGDIVVVDTKNARDILATVADIGSNWVGATLPVKSKHRHKFTETCKCCGLDKEDA